MVNGIDNGEMNSIGMQYQQQMDMSYLPMESSMGGSANPTNGGSASAPPPPPGSWPYYYPPPYYVPSGPYYTAYQRKQYQQQQYYNNMNGLPRAAKSALYKTELCKNFLATGECKYGDMCQFAHGKEQIRQVPVNHRKNQQQQQQQQQQQNQLNQQQKSFVSRYSSIKYKRSKSVVKRRQRAATEYVTQQAVDDTWNMSKELVVPSIIKSKSVYITNSVNASPCNPHAVNKTPDAKSSEKK